MREKGASYSWTFFASDRARGPEKRGKRRKNSYAPHRRHKRLLLSLGRVQPQRRRVHPHRVQRGAHGLLGKLNNAPRVVDLHEAKVRGAVALDGQGPDRDVGARCTVVLDKLEVVHAVEVVSREDDDIFDGAVLLFCLKKGKEERKKRTRKRRREEEKGEHSSLVFLLSFSPLPSFRSLSLSLSLYLSLSRARAHSLSLSLSPSLSHSLSLPLSLPLSPSLPLSLSPSLSPPHQRTVVSENSHAYCLTASAVPWNHSLSVGVCVAASTSTKPSPPKRTPDPTL